MSDYYDLLGVDGDADKDTIRGAYRDRIDGADQSQRAKLNKAWNILSDPVQRGRYDEYLASGAEFGDADDGAEVVVAASSSRASRGAQPVRGARAPRDRAAPRPPLVPTIELPPGMEFAENRQRGMAFLVDFLIVFGIYILTLILLLPAVIKNQYPAESKRIDAINKEAKQLDKDKSKANDRAGNTKLTKSERAAATKQSKSLDKQITKQNDKVTTISKKFQGLLFGIYGALLAVLLAILVPVTALTGKTLGMRFQHIRVVRADGSPVSWISAFSRFLVPLALAIFVPSLGAIAGLA
ncbi:MAG: RDD family protein, partial [Acidimicrobiia bacterium]